MDTKFILEFGDLYIRFWSNDVQVESAPDVPEEVVTPYLEAELYELQMRAVNDCVYIVHPNHPVGKLTRNADDDWDYVAADLNGPYVDPDVVSTDVTLTPSATTGSITITASDDAFNSDHEGSELRLRYIAEGSTQTFSDDYAMTPDSYDDTLDSFDRPAAFNPTTLYETDGDNSKYWKVYYDTGVSNRRECYTCVQDYDATTAWAGSTVYAVDDLVVETGSEYICLNAHTSTGTFATDLAAGKWQLIDSPDDALAYFERGVLAMGSTEVTDEWSLKTTGNWRGEWWIQRSTDEVTWSTIKTLVSDKDSNYLVEEDEEGETAYVRVLAAATNANGVDKEAVTFTILATSAYGVATVDTYNSATSVDATVTTDMPSTDPSVSWQESAFSVYQGYPRSIALFDNRLVMAGTAKKPQAYFYSAINDYDEFLGGTLADSPFFVETLSEDQSAVQWISAQRELFTGTASVEGVLMTRKQDEAQSPENLPIVRWHESMGSAQRPALPIRDSLLTLQRGRTTLNMLSYSLEKDGYGGEEVSLLCPHLFQSKVQQMASIREPYTGVYVVTEAGTICHMVYEPNLQVTGWCEYSTSGGTYESVQTLPGSSDEDDVYVSVKRTINGTTKRHIEKFKTGNTQKQRDSDADNLWYLDNALKTEGTDLTSITGLDHLEGETVTVLADGIKGEYTVASGAITLSLAADTVIVGLPITSTFEPLDVENQGTYSKRKQLHQTKLMLWRSLGGAIATEGKDYQTIVYHTAGETMDESVPLLDTIYEIFHESIHGRQKYWRIKHDEPYPFTLQAVVQTMRPTSK